MEANDLAIPVLPSRSLDATLAFYRRLGFEGESMNPDGQGRAQYGIVTRGDVELHFFLHAELVPGDSWAGCYLRVSDVDAWHRAMSTAGLPAQGLPRVEARPEPKPWGLREFALVDEDGNLLRIGQVIDG